jgi:hypothetical protein
MKSIIIWDMTPCSLLSCNRRLGWTYRLHLQGRKNIFSNNQQVSRWQAYLMVIAEIIYSTLIGVNQLSNKIHLWEKSGFENLQLCYNITTYMLRPCSVKNLARTQPQDQFISSTIDSLTYISARMFRLCLRLYNAAFPSPRVLTRLIPAWVTASVV